LFGILEDSRTNSFRPPVWCEQILGSYLVWKG